MLVRTPCSMAVGRIVVRQAVCRCLSAGCCWVSCSMLRCVLLFVAVLFAVTGEWSSVPTGGLPDRCSLTLPSANTVDLVSCDQGQSCMPTATALLDTRSGCCGLDEAVL